MDAKPNSIICVCVRGSREFLHFLLTRFLAEIKHIFCHYMILSLIPMKESHFFYLYIFLYTLFSLSIYIFFYILFSYIFIYKYFSFLLFFAPDIFLYITYFYISIILSLYICASLYLYILFFFFLLRPCFHISFLSHFFII